MHKEEEICYDMNLDLKMQDLFLKVDFLFVLSICPRFLMVPHQTIVSRSFQYNKPPSK
jgi:hypothetical protein